MKHKIVLDELCYPTVEHAYQAAKTDNVEERSIILECGSPGKAKKLGKHVTIIPNWNRVKKQVMTELIRQKFFPGTELADMLASTGDSVLVEGNTWGDTYWGICNGHGYNHLGMILMKQRDFLNSTGSNIIF